jgi:hypothetical protein
MKEVENQNLKIGVISRKKEARRIPRTTFLEQCTHNGERDEVKREQSSVVAVLDQERSQSRRISVWGVSLSSLLFPSF